LIIDPDQSQRTAAIERFVARHNISHFEALLGKEIDPKERRILEVMLREERGRLAAAEARAITCSDFRLDSDIDHVTC
jgi:hypothetical protein